MLGMRRWAVALTMATAGLWPCAASAQDRFAEYESIVDRYHEGQRGEALLKLSAWPAQTLEPVVQQAARRPWLKARAAVLLHTDRALQEQAAGAREAYERQLQFAARLARTVPKQGTGGRFRARWFLAMALRASHPQGALPWVREGLKEDPENPELLLALASIEETQATFGRGRFQTRLPEREDGIGLAESKAHTLRLEQVKRDLKKALKADENLYEARVRLARVLKYMHDIDGALAELNVVLAKASEPELLYLAQLQLGEIREAQGRLLEAQQAYVAATTLDPRCQTAYIALSHVRWLQGDVTAAATARNQALAHAPSSSGYADPWWRYPLGQLGRGDALLEELRGEATR
jgi:tetratricopeptide (TPR) repeat protein